MKEQSINGKVFSEKKGVPEQPLVSFVLLAYNQENFIQEAVRSVLAQTFEPLEIFMIDDCSTDNTFSLMEKEVCEYNGEYTVKLYQNDKNIGLAASLNRAWEETNGDFLVVQAGDDVSLPERTQLLVNAWRNTEPTPDLVYSDITVVDDQGKVVESIKRLPRDLQISHMLEKGMAAISGCACAYSRRLHHIYGPLNEKVLQEDAVYPFRAMLERGICLVEKPLVRYRIHSNNVSAPDIGTGARRLRDRQWTIRWKENQLAVINEWMGAWKISGRKDPQSLKKLIYWQKMRQVLCEYEIAIFPWVLIVPIKGVLWGLPTKYMASLFWKSLFQKNSLKS